jgi:hypothetical protein
VEVLHLALGFVGFDNIVEVHIALEVHCIVAVVVEVHCIVVVAVVVHRMAVAVEVVDNRNCSDSCLTRKAMKQKGEREKRRMRKKKKKSA